MQVLAINGSPRKEGNTGTLIHAVDCFALFHRTVTAYVIEKQSVQVKAQSGNG